MDKVHLSTKYFILEYLNFKFNDLGI